MKITHSVKLIIPKSYEREIFYFSGFTANSLSLTNNLTNDFNFDYVSATNSPDRYTYRVRQTLEAVSDTISVPQLTLGIWSGT